MEPVAEQPNQKSSRFTGPTPNTIPVIGVFVAIIILVSGAMLTLNKRDNSVRDNMAASPAPQQTAQFQPISPHAVVYGEWRGEKSYINAVSLQDGGITTVAELPNEIKKVSLLSDKSLVYIDGIDNIRDHGKQIAMHTTTDKKTEAVYTADPGFGIDDYVLSPNKQYLAVWEVAVSLESGNLRGGRSRVYGMQMANKNNKHLLYDEEIKEPVHYPRAITNGGEVYLDTFLPNAGSGWAYGMSVARFDGTKKEDLTQMANGTYGTQPVLSPDGKFLLFAGYDGSSGPGEEVTASGRRKALMSNTIELFNVETKVREKLPNLPNENIYTSAKWDSVTGNIVFSIIAKNMGESGYYRYDLGEKNPHRLNIGDAANGDLSSYISLLENGGILVGKPDMAPSNMSNLGDTYGPPFASFTAVMPGNIRMPIIEQAGFMQFIAIAPLSLASAQGEMYPSGVQVTTGVNLAPRPGRKQLQLETFFVKSWIHPARGKMQSNWPEKSSPELNPSGEVPITDKTQRKGKNGTCAGLAWEICSKQMYGNEDYHTDMGSKDVIDKTWNNKEWNSCRNKVLQQLNVDGICIGSPLYLYGEKGQKVLVKIHTPVYNDAPLYDNGYDVTLLQDGLLRIGEEEYESISYDYEAAVRRLPAPSYGHITSSKGLDDTLHSFARKLGLNKKETKDLIEFAHDTIVSPYVFVSFYDQRTSHQILPLSFRPEPDVYINIVFYFKQLGSKPKYTPVPPVFPEIPERKGFTAVEISGIVE